MIEAIELWGAYDGSVSSRAKAREAYSILENKIGDWGANYESVLTNSNLPIPLCAIYSFVIGAYIQTGMWDSNQLRLRQAQMNAQTMGLFFPQYKQ